MSANRTKSSRSSSGNIFPVLLLGALGVGIAYYFYQNSESSTGSGSSSGSLYDIIGGAATNSDPALSPAAAAAGMGAGSASVIGTGLSSSSSGSSSFGSSGSSYVAEVGKKAATVQNYQAIDADFVNSINSQLMNIYGEGSAYNFAKVPSNAAAAATIQNTGINNAGKELLSIVNSDYSYQVYDSRGQIVSSGSPGAFQGNVILNTGSRSSSGSSGSSSSGSSVSSKKSLSVSSSGSSKETVAITADKAAAHSAGVYSDKISGTATIGYKKSSSSGSSGSSSSGSSSSSSGGYAMGGAVRSNTTAGKYTG